MGLKAHQKVVADDINFRLDSVQTRGLVCGVSATAGECEVVADPSGVVVAGLLMMDVVNKGVPANLASDSSLDTGTISDSLTNGKNETYKGGLVRLLRKGECSTSSVTGAIAQGDALYLAASGIISATQATGAPQVGFALEAKDSDGFVKMFLDV